MYNVSTAYKKAMKEPLRERAYIKVMFGLFNSQAQSGAEIASFEPVYYSNPERFFEQQEQKDICDFAILDDDFTRVDGSMYFVPQAGDWYGEDYLPTGLTSAEMTSKRECVLKINLNMAYLAEIKGLSIEFGDTYPVDFDIICDGGEKIEIRGNDTKHFRTEEVIPKTSTLTFKFNKMNSAHTHVHIHYMLFGLGLVYTNEQVTSATLTSYVSPIAEEVPQTDFEVTVTNLDKYFNVDNPKSAINFFETGQTMEVLYGQYIKEEERVEWVHGSTLWCDDWSANDETATIRCVDRLRLADSPFGDGRLAYNEQGGATLYELAKEVLDKDGVESYYIDPYLQTLRSPLPIPYVPTREALQMIANAGQATVAFERDGSISIRSNFIPDRFISCNEENEKYSNVQNILINDKKDEYANLDTDYTIVDGDMYMRPVEDDPEPEVRNYGFISKEQSDKQGKFKTNPIITISQGASRKMYGLDIVFGYALPSGIKITAENAGGIVDEFEVTENITKNMTIERDFPDLDTIHVEFTGTEKPISHVVVNYLNFSSIAAFTMEKNDICGSVTVTKETNVQNLIVSYYTYTRQSEPKAKELVKIENKTVEAGQVETFYFEKGAYDYAPADETLLEIVDSGVFYVTVRYKKIGTFTVIVNGLEFVVVEQTLKRNLNPEGEDVEWKNPLIGTKELAEKVLNWLTDYYSDTLQYEYSHRGFPEIDATDIIAQDNDFIETMYVEPCEFTTTFNGAFGGSAIVRRRDL